MNLAFDVVFAIFVVLIVGLAVISVRWAVRRDRAERARRAAQLGEPAITGTAPHSGTPDRTRNRTPNRNQTAAPPSTSGQNQTSTSTSKHGDGKSKPTGPQGKRAPADPTRKPGTTSSGRRARRR